MNPFRRFVRVAPDGSVTEERLSKAAPTGADWIEIPPEQHYMMGNGPHRLRWDEESGLQEKARIRLSVGARTFPADGETPVAIGVRDVPAGRPVTVTVNGAAYQITSDDDIMLTSDAPGEFLVRVDDPYHYAAPRELTITATETDDA